ncbi:unnamed protein product, partial [Brenthis ino]
MHYGRKAFSKTGEDTIVPKKVFFNGRVSRAVNLAIGFCTGGFTTARGTVAVARSSSSTAPTPCEMVVSNTILIPDPPRWVLFNKNFALCHKKSKFASLYCMCVIKCLAMSQAELEDFSTFLQETSQLDQNVKSNIPNDYDDDVHVSDHAWEESGKFEGDLILNDRQRRMIVASVAEGLARNGISDTTKRWPNNEVIYYIQIEHFSNDQIQSIQNGIDDLARASCVKFTPYKKGDRDAVVIQGSRRGCFSQVGYQGGYQIMNLNSRHPAGRGCFRHGTVVHEMLHTLGFYHMQSSPDRDDYIDVLWPNILKKARHNFRKYNSFSVSDFGVGYDYDSVLHYSRKAFSVNGQDTLVPKQLGAQIGQRIGMSDKDIEKLNKMYCDADSDLPSDSNDSIQKVHKKKHKNKPFEGQGLGYQKVNQRDRIRLFRELELEKK